MQTLRAERNKVRESKNKRLMIGGIDDIVVWFVRTGPFWAAVPFLLGIFGAWYFRIRCDGTWRCG